MKLTEQDYLDILTDTLENNAIGYWATYLDHHRNSKSYIVEMTIADDDTNKQHIINKYTIEQGLERVLSEGFQVAEWVKNQILTKDFDIITDDVLIQAAIFNDILYG